MLGTRPRSTTDVVRDVAILSSPVSGPIIRVRQCKCFLSFFLERVDFVCLDLSYFDCPHEIPPSILWQDIKQNSVGLLQPIFVGRV